MILSVCVLKLPPIRGSESFIKSENDEKWQKLFILCDAYSSATQQKKLNEKSKKFDP